MNRDLFEIDNAQPHRIKSTVGELAGIGPTTPETAGTYPRPWYFTWDSPVWRVMAQDRTVVATCSDEECARLIAAAFK